MLIIKSCKTKFISSLLLMFAVACSNENNVLQILQNEFAIVREVKGTNNLFVFDLQSDNTGLYSSYIVPSNTLHAEYKEDGLSVFISGDITNNSIAIDGYVSEGKGSSVTLSGKYNMFEITTMSKGEGGKVPFKACPCENQPLTEVQFPLGIEAYLFREPVTEQMLREPPLRKQWIVFDSETGNAYLWIQSGIPGSVPGIGRICNFPDFAKEWDIPETGLKVYFEGLTYEICQGGCLGNVNCFDLILTNLTRR